MSEKQTYQNFLGNQDQVYDKFRATSHEVGVTKGIEKDPGTAPQGAFLVAWRYPDTKTALVEEFSLQVSDLIAAIPYGKKNAHTTVSDYGLKPELLISPAANKDQAEILNGLSTAVRNALDVAKQSRITGFGVEFKDTPTNGKTIIAAGIPTEAVWELNQQVLAESAKLRIDLKGSWGSHMTVNRFLEDKPAESKAVADVMQLIGETPSIGPIEPVAIDVGYFQADPHHGFEFTVAERFEIGKVNF